METWKICVKDCKTENLRYLSFINYMCIEQIVYELLRWDTL